MVQRATSSAVKIVVIGEPKPYRERSTPYVRKRPGKRGQPVGSLSINSVMPKAHETYQRRISAAAQRAMSNEPMMMGPVRLAVRAYVPIPKKTTRADLAALQGGLLYACRRPDMTNIIKLAEDALSGIVFKDDNQVVRGSDDTGRYYSRWPRIEIEVTELGEACALQAAEMAREGADDLKKHDPIGSSFL